MNEPGTAQDRTPTTAQIAAAGTADADDRTSPGQDSVVDDMRTERPMSDRPAEQPMSDTSAEQPMSDMPSEQPMSDTSAEQPMSDMPSEQPMSDRPAAAGSAPETGENTHAQLLEDDELQRIHAQWKDIQAAFVDEPRKAVQDADTLVADLMQRLAQMFASERDQLESRWSSGNDVSTEELRHGLRRYRSFFERLLAA
jgi:hypothetical protein